MKILQSILLLAGLSASTVILVGCKTVGRENIISTINTGIGATLTENPQTQLYEVKLGFIRTQFYSVPTGKNVEGTNQTNDASQTPEVVSGIRANSGIQHLILGMDVSESFAVGKTAVMSPAAVAMYVANARDEGRAREAAKASSALSTLGPTPGTASINTINGMLAFLKELPPADFPEKEGILKGTENLRSLTPTWDFARYAWIEPETQLAISLMDAESLPAGYAGFKKYHGTLRTSIATLQSVTTNTNFARLQAQVDGGSTNTMTAEQFATAKDDLKTQSSRLRNLDKQLAEHPAVIRLFDYFNSVTTQ